MPLPLAEIDWNALLQGSSELLPLLVLFGVAGLIGMTAIIAVQWRKVHEVRLKEKMIDRGFTADEIVRVINARASQRRRRQTARSADPAEPVVG